MSAERLELNAKLQQVFTPTRPITDQDTFAGRIHEIARVLSAIGQPGQHAIIYGERGVGKTSLANCLLFARFAHAQQIKVAKIAASESSTFYSLWSAALGQFPMPEDMHEVGQDESQQETMFERKRNQSCADAIPLDATPDDVINVLAALPECAIIIDEFDRVLDPLTKSAFADTIKHLSDDSELNVTLILVGVADNIEELIAEHASIERCTKQVHVQRMPHEELEEIVNKGFKRVGMGVAAGAASAIATLSQGFPHYTHQIALNAGLIALARNRNGVVKDDIRDAIVVATKDAAASLQKAYVKAITSTQKNNLDERILVACSLADSDELGYFAPVDVRAPLCEIVGEDISYQTFGTHLSRFCEDGKGRVLQKILIEDSQRFRYRFCNPLMRPYVFLRGIENGLVPAKYSPF